MRGALRQRGNDRTRRLFEDDVRVGPSEAVGAHAGTPRPLATRPGARLPRNDEGPLGEAHEFVQLAQMKVRRDLFALERENALDDPCDARRRLQVADVRLDQSDRAHVLRRAALGKHRRERAHLDGITERSPGPVGLDVADICRPQPRR